MVITIDPMLYERAAAVAGLMLGLVIAVLPGVMAGVIGPWSATGVACAPGVLFLAGLSAQIVACLATLTRHELAAVLYWPHRG